jgi:phosphoribosylcarboxyaminoimidazole (NCAIR) mutase
MAKLTVIKPVPATLAAVMEQMPSEVHAISTSLKQNNQAAASLMDILDCSHEQLAEKVHSWKTATSGGQTGCN